MNKHHKSREEILKEHAEIQAAQKDPKRFGVLYDRYFKVIFVFVFRRMADADASGDVTANVFMKAMIGLKKFKATRVPFSAWLFRIAISEIAQYYRKSKKGQHVVLDETIAMQMLNEVDENADNEEVRVALLDALSRLDRMDSDIVEMRFFEGLSFKEIGEVLGVKEAAAKIRTYRILEKVKKTITLKRNHGSAG
ncbi:MAG: sigma-70 family RNA polymerase sigma factor [Flavobacteriales bacterium]|nr:sigma-70 family RNA polymerase sigma factor [Flavobacteriales bacterium]